MPGLACGHDAREPPYGRTAGMSQGQTSSSRCASTMHPAVGAGGKATAKPLCKRSFAAKPAERLSAYQSRAGPASERGLGEDATWWQALCRAGTPGQA